MSRLASICVFFSAVLASAQQAAWPAQTAWEAAAHPELVSRSPAPTEGPAPQHLRRRSVYASGSVCGYVTADAHWPVACNEGEYCSTDGEHAWLCCSTSSRSYSDPFTDDTLSINVETFTLGVNCTHLGPTTCYNLNQTAQCTGSCASIAAICTDSNYPACASLISSSCCTPFTLAYCDTSSYVLPVDYQALDYLTAAATSTPAGYTFTLPKPSITSEASTAASGAAPAAQATTASAANYLVRDRLLLYTFGLLGFFFELH